MMSSGNLHPGARMKRLLEMLWLLQAGGTRSSEELRVRFNVSRRTIFRDIQLLRDTGVPIVVDECDRGYRLLTETLSFVQLEPLELLALAVMNDSKLFSYSGEFRRRRDLAIAKLISGADPEIRSQVLQALETLKQFSSTAPLDPVDERAVNSLVESWLHPPPELAKQSRAPTAPEVTNAKPTTPSLKAPLDPPEGELSAWQSVGHG